MAIAHDAASVATAGTGNLSWTHTPAGVPSGVLVLVVQNGSATDQVSSVTYGGVALTEVALSPLLGAAGSEDGSVHGFFRGTGLPTGAQTVSVTVSGAESKLAVALTVAANRDTYVEDTSTLDQASGADPSLSLTTTVETVIYGAIHSGVANLGNLTPGSGYTQVHEEVMTAAAAGFEGRTANASAGSPTVSWTMTSDEAHVLAVAIGEEPPHKLFIREAPRLGLTHEIQTPSGNVYRWAEDEPDPANVPNGVRFSSTMPGGFEGADATLPRKPGTDFSDLGRLSDWKITGPGGEAAWEGRLERAPRVSGDEVAVSPSAVGWQAHLEDDKSAQMVYVDADLGGWEGATQQRRIDYLTAGGETFGDPSVDGDSSLPALSLNISGLATGANDSTTQADYDAGPEGVGDVYMDWTSTEATANIEFLAGVADDRELGGSVESSDLYGAAGADYLSNRITISGQRYVVIRTRNQVAYALDRDHPMWVRKLTVYGSHGLEPQGDAPGGLLASDVIAHAVGRWAPLLTFSTGSNGTIRPSTFVIPHLAFREPTTAAEIVRQANRFHLRDWAVWEDKAFHYHDRGERGRTWRARVYPSKLQETGPQMDRLWESIVVAYQDADGSTKTVGPPGSGADTESADLKDLDPENPANQLGITRRDLLSIGVTTAAGATEVGKRFLEETKALDSSGQAQFVGMVEDSKGIERPAWQVRAGDQVEFVDASDSSARRIVKADYSDSDRTCSVDLDAPPEALAALLERLDARLVRLGL